MKFLFTKSFLAMILIRVCLAEDEKRDYLIGAIKRKEEDRLANDEASGSAANRRVHDNIVEGNKEDQRQAIFHEKTRDKVIPRHVNEESGNPDVDLGRLSLDGAVTYVGNHHGEWRRKIRGIRREMQEKVPSFEPTSEPSVSNEPSLMLSSDVPTLGPSSSNGPTYGSSSAPTVSDESSFPSVSDETSFPSVLDESSFGPSFEILNRDESSLSPSSEVFDQIESSFAPSAEPSASNEPSPSNEPSASNVPSFASESPPPEKCTIPDLTCQEFFQSRYPGFFIGGMLTCDDPLQVTLPMYSEGCDYYRGMSCPSCRMICEDGYPVSKIPLVACCAEACVTSCDYLSCNLP